MRAVVATPSGKQRVEIQDGVGEPEAAGNEAIVSVESFSLNRGELTLLGFRPDGWRPGQDIAGTVEVAAADGSGPPAGTRIAALVDQAGWAQRVAVPTDRLAIVPDGIDVAHAAALPMAGLTALRTLALGGAVLGRRVLVTGAAGGVGHLQTQLAAAAGAQVVAVTRRESMRQYLYDAGARSIVATVDEAEGPFELILDGVGGRSLAVGISKTAPAATIVLFGASDPEPARLGFHDFGGHENTSIRTYFSYANTANLGTDLAVLLELMRTGKLSIRIGMHRSWSEVNAGLDDLAAGAVDGKAVIDTA